MSIIKIILIWLLFFFTVTFSFQNAQEVQLRYEPLTESFNVPLFTVVLAALLVGIIIGAVGGLLTNMQLRSQLRRQKKEVERVQEEPTLDQNQGSLTPEASSANLSVE